MRIKVIFYLLSKETLSKKKVNLKSIGAGNSVRTNGVAQEVKCLLGNCDADFAFVLLL